MFRHSLNFYLIERLKRENELRNIDRQRWYEINSKCLPDELVDRFHQLHYDRGTDTFINRCYAKSESFMSMFFYAIARSILKIFMSSTSVCGLLGCGSMYVFSEEQFRSFVIEPLLDHCKDKILCIQDGTTCCNHHEQQHSLSSSSNSSSSDDDDEGGPPEVDRLIEIGGDASTKGHKFEAVIDLGAGDGNVTAIMAPYFHRVYTTEMSRFMHAPLKKKGFTLLDAENWGNSNGPVDSFTLISLLNVLDRCDRPLDMLADIHRSLRSSNGLFLLAVVFPLYQYVEYKPNHEPDQILPLEGETFEHQVGSFYERVLVPAGFELIRWSKLPYLCEGNIDLTYFWLIDAVFLLKAVDLPEKNISGVDCQDITVISKNACFHQRLHQEPI